MAQALWHDGWQRPGDLDAKPMEGCGQRGQLRQFRSIRERPRSHRLSKMSMLSLRCSIIAVVVAGSIATPWAIRHHNRSRLREQNESLQQQAKSFAELSAENRRLSDFVAQSGGALASNDEVKE